MSVKIVRFHANESAFTKNGRLRTEINVPSSVGVTDLTSSKLVLDMHMELSDASGDVLLPVTFGNQQQIGGAQALIRNASVISQTNGVLNERRNQNVISANLDWYQSSRAQEDQRSLLGNSTNSNYGIDRFSLLPDNPFILWKKPTALTGGGATITESAITRRAEIPVAWKNIDNFATMSQFPNVAVGDLTYRVELEDQMNVAFPAKMPFQAAEPCDNRAAVASLLGNSGAPLTLTKTTANYFRPPQQGDLCVASFLQATTGNYKTVSTSGIDEIDSVAIVGGKYVVTLKNGFATTGATESCTGIKLYYFSPTDMLGPSVCPIAIGATVAYNAAGYGSSAVPLVFAKNTVGGMQTTLASDAVTVDSLNTIPWYVGAPVQLCGTDVSGSLETAVSHEAKISSVKVNGDNVEIILDSPLAATGAGYALTVPVLCYRDSLAGTKMTCNWNIDEIYAELFKIQMTPAQMSKLKDRVANVEMPFLDQMLVQRNMPANSSAHTEVLQAMAGTVGLAVLTPQNQTFLSGFDGCNRYRFSINGKEVTNQDIEVGAADLVGRQLHNYFLKSYFGNLGQALKKYDAPQHDYNNTADTATHTVYPLIVPNLGAESVIQLQLFSDSTMGGKNIFYVFTRQKLLKISGGRVMVSA